MERRPRLAERRSQGSRSRLAHGAPLLLLLLAAFSGEAVEGRWERTPRLLVARSGHTATVLQDGRVLVAGGSSASGAPLKSAEIFDPATGGWASAGEMTRARTFHTATLLRNGKVLLVGGENVASAELFDPASGLWAPAPAPLLARYFHTATRLDDGRVLVVGGGPDPGGDYWDVHVGVEFYEPTAGVWTDGGELAVGFKRHATVLLPTGQALVVAGDRSHVFDAPTNTWARAWCPLARGHTATVLADGSVMFAGGEEGPLRTWLWGSAGLIDGPPLLVPRSGHAAALLPDGRVLITGGVDPATGVAQASAELFDPASSAMTPAGTMSDARTGHTASVLPDGKVLLAGGAGPLALASTETFGPSDPRAWQPAGTLQVDRAGGSVTTMPSGRVLVCGGGPTCEIYDPASGGWTVAGTSPSYTYRAEGHTATLLGNGKVLLVGGVPLEPTSPYHATVELIDESAAPGELFAGTGSLPSGRAHHTATLLPDGRVLVAGGLGESGASAEAFVYDPGNGTWTATGSMLEARSRHSASLLKEGRVLVVGGLSSTALGSAELYDPGTGTFTAVGVLASPRYGHTATLLTDGTVLVAGGKVGTSYLASAETFEPSTRLFRDVGSLPAGRAFHAAALLVSGDVLLAGGTGSTAAVGSSSALYSPRESVWRNGPTSASARPWARSVLLGDGQVLLVGNTTAERLDLVPGTWASSGFTGSMTYPRQDHTATLLPDGKALVVGGLGANRTELYDPKTGSWTEAGALSNGRAHHATALVEGKVIVTGGLDGSSPLQSAEGSSDGGSTWGLLLPLVNPRAHHGAASLSGVHPDGAVFLEGGAGTTTERIVLSGGGWFSGVDSAAGHDDAPLVTLRDGRLFVAGGRNSVTSELTAVAEIFDPGTMQWTSAGTMSRERVGHTTTVLADGRVLVAGGTSSNGMRPAEELYDPATGTWTLTGSMAISRSQHTATLLPDGRVLVAGSWTDPYVLTETYDPTQGLWEPSGSLRAGRVRHTATMLPDRSVLLVGGQGTATGEPLATAELIALTPGADDARRSQVTTVPASIRYGVPFAIEGLRFGGDSEATGGSSSGANHPVVRLQSLENGRVSTLLPDELPAPGSGTATLAFSSLPPNLDSGPHLLTVNVAGVLGLAKVVQVECSLVITSHPASVTRPKGSTATFTVVAAGARSYQWQVDDTGGGTWQDIPGAAGASYTTPPVSGPDSGKRFRALVAGTCQVASSSPATLTLEDTSPPAAHVVSPSGGEFWQLSPAGGKPNLQTVVWSMADDVRVCRIDLSLRASLDGGTTWGGVAAGGGLPASFGPGGTCTHPGEGTTSLTYTVPTAFPTGQSGSLYRIRVVVTDHAGLATVAESPSPFYIVSPNPDSVRTLILANTSRMQALGIATAGEAVSLTTKLRELAGHPRVQGLVVDLGAVSTLTSLYALWDASPTDPALANDVLFAEGGLHPYLRSVLAAYSGVTSVVLVGDDRVIPMARMPDDTALLPESAYVTGPAPALRATTRVGAALASDAYLSDDPLGVLDPVSPGDLPGALFVPDLALGRLVETPAEITSVVATFISQDGVLDISDLDPDVGHKVLLTGYDFLTSVATQARKRWKSALGVDTPAGSLAPVDGSLVGASWGHGDPAARAAELREHLGGNGGERYAVVSLNGHASHWEEGVPGTDPQDIRGLAAVDLYGDDACVPPTASLGALAFEGAFVYALGCHGGLNVPGSCSTDADHSLDLPQTFLSRGAVAYVANTGYGWGLRNGIGYSARLTQLLTEELTSGGTRAVGESILRTKRRYVLESPRFDPYDLKVLMQWTTFGLPMYAIRTGIGETAERQASMVARPGETVTESLGPVAVEKSLGTSAAASALAARADGDALPPYLTQLNLHFDLSGPGVYRKHDSLGNDLDAIPGCPDSDGCYYTLNGLVDRGSGAADLPIQPYLVYDSRLSGTSQHGVLWKGGTYVEDPDFRFVVATLVSNATPTADHGSTPRMAIIRPTEQRLVVGPDSPGCRPSDLELNSLTVAGGEAGKVLDTDPSFTINRLYRSVTLEALYFNDTVTPTNNCDRSGPGLGAGPFAGEYHRVGGASLEWAVHPSEPAWRVVVVYNDNGVDALGRGEWRPLELVDDGEGTFRGRADLTPGRRVTYVIQAVDHRGNVTWLDYQAAQLPASGVPLGVPRTTDVSLPVLPPVVVTGMSPTAGPVGTMVTLTGSGFSGATSVRLAGTSSSFQVLSDTLLVFFVPPAAATGAVQVTGPAGTGESAASFVVTWPSVSVGDVIVPLGPGPTTATFTVSLAGARLLPVTVAFATQDGSALAGTDYLAASGVLEMPPGTDGGTVDVAVLGVSPPAVTKGFRLVLSGPVNAVLGDGNAWATLLGAGEGTKLATLTPCRVIDTRSGTGPLAGPALEPYPARRVFALAGSCGIPAGAAAIVANLTVAEAGAPGDLKVYPGELSSAEAGVSSAISFAAGKTRANNALVKLAPDGSIAVENSATASVQMILDVSGYFR